MHNHRREYFFQAQAEARARALILDRYIEERVAHRQGQRVAEAAHAATVHVLHRVSNAPSRRYAAVAT